MVTDTSEKKDSMEFHTTVEDFYKKAERHHLMPKTFIRVIVEESQIKLEDMKTSRDSSYSNQLPIIPWEEQKRILDSMPNEFGSENSKEWIKLIRESRINTNRRPFDNE